MIPRTAAQEALDLARQFKAVAIVGPRQSGKTTLVRHVFPDKTYANLENPDLRSFAQDDPRGFLAHYPNGAILDEVQRVPQLFSYLQQWLDETEVYGQFILTGSNNFILQEGVSQSLAGRVGYLYLLPLSLSEWPGETDMLSQTLFRGGYPALYQDHVQPERWYVNYIRTYVERDVRLIKNITNLNTFERFLKLCAGRIGQLLNMSSLAVETGVDVKTIGSWLSVLESSFVLFRLPPYHRNYNKRIVKMPKLYFYDTGLATALLGVENAKQLDFHPLRGALFENLVILEFLKERLHRGKPQNLFFWRDNTGHEVDLLLDFGTQQQAIEIKLGQTITQEYFKGLKYWNKISKTEGGYVVYGGAEAQKRSGGFEVVPYHQLPLFPME
jgi:hypothetical protein